jgi:hypothetical protein
VGTAGFRKPSRYLALFIVAGLHLLAIVVLRVELAVNARDDDTLSQNATPPLIVSFLELVEPSEAEPAPAVPAPLRPLASVPPPDAGSSAISVPAPPPSPSGSKAPQAPVDWDMELKRSAQAMIDRAEEQAKHDAAFARRGEVPESMRPMAPEENDFSWSYRANRIQGGAIRISEHCALVMGILPVCQFGKLPVRTNLLADMRKPKTPDELGVTRSKSLENVDRETRIRLAAVSRLLAEWRAAHGKYPDDLTELVAAAAPAAAPAGVRVSIMDTWNQKILYKNPSQASICEYDLYSMGPNGVDDRGERDDIVTCGSTADIKF